MKPDQEEQEILDAYDKGQLHLSAPTGKDKEKIRAMAEETFRKDRRVTIRVYEHDLRGIQKIAMRRGMPYQTLISAMIHQYVEGDLVEKRGGGLRSS